MKIIKSYAENLSRNKIDMTLSENPLGCSPLVLESLKAISGKNISQYPNDNTLLAKIAKQLDLEPDNIIVSTGSEQLIKLTCQIFLTRNDQVIIQRNSFGLFSKETQLIDARIEFFSPLEILKITSCPKIIFLCSPNNPTGEIIDQKLVTKITKRFANTIIILDEANGEFASKSFAKSTVSTENVLILKTFSKAYGLAGLRIGFGVGSRKLIRKLRFNQQPFPVSIISLRLAQTALEDKSFLDRTKQFVKKENSFILKKLKELGLQATPSNTFNIFIEYQDADKLIESLKQLGVSVISGREFPGNIANGFRIAIRDKKTNRLFLRKLKEAISLVSENNN